LSNALQFALITLVVMLLVRRVVGDRERRAELAERERDLAAREAVVEERARIARELHDAIAHDVSMMVLQAGAERRALDGKGGTAREVLETIERIGRGALTGCASASPCTAAVSTPAAARAAASPFVCCSRSDDEHPDRRRPGARQSRAAQDSRSGAGDVGRGRGRRR